MKYFDAHCHLQFEQYGADREAVIEAMRAQGVGGLVVGCDYTTSREAVALAEKHEHLYAAVGMHPNHGTGEVFDAVKYRELAQSPKVVAIGECGLDYFRPEEVNDEVKEKQKALLREQVALARELGKALTLHIRPSKGSVDAYHDAIEILKEAKADGGLPAPAGDIHFFVGGVAEMQEFTALGFTVSYTAVVTFARDYDEVIRATPLDSLLVETDAPYVAPLSRRGQRNDPLAIPEIVAKIALIRGEEPELVREALIANTKRVFGLSSFIN